MIHVQLNNFERTDDILAKMYDLLELEASTALRSLGGTFRVTDIVIRK